MMCCCCCCSCPDCSVLADESQLHFGASHLVGSSHSPLRHRPYRRLRAEQTERRREGAKVQLPRQWPLQRCHE